MPLSYSVDRRPILESRTRARTAGLFTPRGSLARSGREGGCSLVYLDPPYYGKGRDLYPNYYKPEDHDAIARVLHRRRGPWILTYDDCVEIRRLYKAQRILRSELSYSAREVRRGREVVVFGRHWKLPPLPSHPRTEYLPSFEVK